MDRSGEEAWRTGFQIGGTVPFFAPLVAVAALWHQSVLLVLHQRRSPRCSQESRSLRPARALVELAGVLPRVALWAGSGQRR